jgi:hypothetical protein
LIGELFKLLPTLNGLGQSVDFFWGDASSKVLAVLPNLVLVIGTALAMGMPFGGAGLGLERTVFHVLDLLHLLEDLLPFLSERIHEGQ